MDYLGSLTNSIFSLVLLLIWIKVQEKLAGDAGKGHAPQDLLPGGVGDRVKVEMNPYDLTQATICFRLKEMTTNVNPPKRSFGPRHGAARKPNAPKR